MICDSCKDKRHGDCRGGSWCDCQHRVTSRPDQDATEDLTGDGELTGELGESAPEPSVNWQRQG
ncbi:hypothetical protein ABZW11_36640 [Nonomuraea sp. NPDC004580]|uniref:hypothetical protein n=1 Tax=Nonomuraea sp. NPDC004580 TaxID=3154552 RepID=UPI0033AFB885